MILDRGASAERLTALPDSTGASFTDLVHFLSARSAEAASTESH